MNLVSVFSLRIVTLQMSVVTICTGCWLVGELLLVFFYKASQPPVFKIQRVISRLNPGFFRYRFPLFPWGLWNEDASSMFGLGKHHCRTDCYQALMPKRFSSDHVWTLWKPHFKVIVSCVESPSSTGAYRFSELIMACMGTNMILTYKRIAMLLNYAEYYTVRPLGTIYNTITSTISYAPIDPDRWSSTSWSGICSKFFAMAGKIVPYFP